MSAYRSLGDIVLDAARVLLPPDRLSVSDAAAKYRYLNNPGAYVGPWRNETVPYLREPMDTLASRQYREWVYVKPAQSGGTECALNLILQTILLNPADIRFYEKTESAARDFSKDKLAKLFRYCPEAKSELLTGKKGDTTHTKYFRAGTHLRLSWPSENELAGHSTGINFLTDYDRMPQDVGGEGSPFSLARMRSTSFGSFAMTAADSSPSFPIQDASWRCPRETPHMGPPCGGIISLYNEGDRRRWYWPCPDCGAYYEPSFRLLVPGDHPEPADAARGVVMACPSCGLATPPTAKHEMNLAGVWLREADLVALSGGAAFVDKAATRKKAWRIALDKPEAYNTRASFWLKGPAAAFQGWEAMMAKWLSAQRIYAATGDDGALKGTINTDQCEAYSPPRSTTDRSADELAERAEALGERVVPTAVHCLLATVDVQRNRFEVQVQGVAPGGDLFVVDRFALRKSTRIDAEGHPWPVRPASHEEDWNLITEHVVERTYPLGDGSGRRMAIRAVGIDSGGEAGATEKAYAYYRKLRRAGLHTRVRLLKGGSTPNAPRVRLSHPDSNRKDRNAGARGEVPVLLLNVNMLKDALDARLDVQKAGDGMVHFPDWLPLDFFAELCAETRTKKGWAKIAGRKNESTDLIVYALALMIDLKLETMPWGKPFRWAAPWDMNSLVIAPAPAGDTKAGDDKRTKKQTMAEWAKRMG